MQDTDIFYTTQRFFRKSQEKFWKFKENIYLCTRKQAMAG